MESYSDSEGRMYVVRDIEDNFQMVVFPCISCLDGLSVENCKNISTMWENVKLYMLAVKLKNEHII